MRPDQPCIFFLTVPSLALLLPQSLKCREQAELQLKEQIAQNHNLRSPGEGIFSGRCRKTPTQTSQDLYACNATMGTSSHFAGFIDLNGFHETRKKFPFHYTQSSTFVSSAEVKGKWRSTASCLKSRRISLEIWGTEDAH